jgi:hypothetical protein
MRHINKRRGTGGSGSIHARLHYAAVVLSLSKSTVNGWEERNEM